MSLLNTALDSSLTTLITSSLKVATAQMPSRKAPRWSEKDINRVRALLPFCSAKVVGQMLGRSEDAIKIMRQRQHIKASSKSEGWLSANRVMRLLGMPDARPVIGWVKKVLVLGHRATGDDTWKVHEISLRRWIVSPISWLYFDTERIQDPHLACLVELAQQKWGDKWLTTRQVADMKRTTTRQVGQTIFRRQLPAIHIVGKDGRHENGKWAFWGVKRSDAEAWQFKPPAYDLIDRRHAFILLAGAIGLSGMTIGRMVNLCHATTSQRFSLMNNPPHLRIGRLLPDRPHPEESNGSKWDEGQHQCHRQGFTRDG